MAAVLAGADALGFVFYEGSARSVTAEAAAELVYGLPAMVTTVALFVDAGAAEVDKVCATLSPALLQFHGDESPEFCTSFGRPWMKALRVGDAGDLGEQFERYKQANAILLDTYRPGQPGGTGETFDWNLVPDSSERPIVLAGGLNSGNVGAAIGAVRPFAVDVSGGVESAPGEKDAGKIADFLAAVRTADGNYE